MTSSEQGQIAEQIRERLERLRGQDLTDIEMEAEVQHLLVAGETAVPILLEQFRGEDETLLAVATRALKAWGEPRPVQPLIALLRDRGVDALAKALILNILERYGLDVDRPELLGLSIDLEEYGPDAEGDGGNGEQDR